MTGTIVDLTSLSTNFPPDPNPEVIRTNVVNTLRTLLQDSVYAVSVEGPEGVGKTSVLSQFARRHCTNAISLFLSAANRLSYDVDLLRFDVTAQVFWAATGEILDRHQYDPALLKSYYQSLQHKARQIKDTFYFIVDGLEDLSVADQISVKQQLVDILPAGIPQFRFLFSGDDKLYRDLLHSTLPLKSYPLTEFSLEETRALFSSQVFDSDVLNELNSLCRGMPGRLAVAARAIANGISPEQLLLDAPSKWPEFFDLDWQRVDQQDNDQLRILSLLVFDSKLHSVDSAASVLGLEPETVRAKLAPLTFLRTDVASGNLHFVSAGLRKYCAQNLSSKKRSTQQLLIKRLLAQPQSDESVLELPGYLEEADEYSDLLTLLTPTHILQVLERTQTLSRVDDTVQRGFRGAQKLGRDADLLRFAIQQSIITDLASSNVWESEVAALASVKRDPEALALANNAMLREDRLQMLTILARRIWERGDTVPDELVEQIKLLIGNLDYWSLGKRAGDIASSLVCVNPDLATEVLRKAKWATDNDELDRMFARFTVSALSDLKDDQRRSEAIESAVRTRRSSKSRDMLEGVRVLSGRMAPDEVLKKVDGLSDASARIAILRYWCVLNGTSPGAEEVATRGLNLALATPSATMDAEMLADFSQALNGDSSLESKLPLISLLDGLRATAERLGPSVHYVRLQLALGRAEIALDKSSAENRFLQIIEYVSKISDLPSRGEAYARVLGALSRLRRKTGFEFDSSALKEVSGELEGVVLTLSDSTADQYLALGGIICGLAADDLERALDYTRVVNTEERRDDILLDTVDILLRRSVDEIDPLALRRVYDSITSIEDRGQAIFKMMQRLAAATSVKLEQIERLLPLLEETTTIWDSMTACRSLVCSLQILNKVSDGRHETLRQRLTVELKKRWATIDIGWTRVDAGFGIAEDLAQFSVSDAEAFINDTDALKNEWQIAAQPGARTYVASIRLLIRTFCGLLPRHLETDADIDALSALIDILPSYGERALLWADVSMRAYLTDRADLAERVAHDRMCGALAQVSRDDSAYRASVLVRISPALYKAMPITCFEELDKLHSDDRDYAILQIIRFVLQQRMPFESADTNAETAETRYDTLLQVAALTERLSTDWMIYVIARDVADCITSPRNRYSITFPQREDIGRRFADIANSKLPIVRQIAHVGYKVAVVAQTLRMRQSQRDEWERLIRDAKSITNIADRAYVLQIIALALPKKMGTERELLLTEVQEAIEHIPWQGDQIERLLGLAEDLHSSDITRCRNLIIKAAQAIGSGSEARSDIRRRLIDLAYRVDEEFARKLIEAFDADDAKQAHAQVRLLELRASINAEEEVNNRDKLLKQLKTAEVSRLGVMLLRALDAGRMQSFHPNEIRAYLALAARSPLNRAAPLLSWYVANAVTRYSKTDQAATFLRPMFEACVVGTQLAGQISGRALVRLRSLKSVSSELSSRKSLSVTPATKDQALQVLTEWFEKNLGEVVKIHDPYFSPEEMGWLQAIRTARPNCRITVLTARKTQPTLMPGEELEDLYDRAWKRQFDQAPPNVEIAIIGGDVSKGSPIHDRWLVSGAMGLRFGTSLNSLGITKDSEISEMGPDDVEQRTAELDQYLNREKIEHNGERLRLIRFNL